MMKAYGVPKIFGSSNEAVSSNHNVNNLSMNGNSGFTGGGTFGQYQVRASLVSFSLFLPASRL
jgi:hypothetical protein